MLLEAVLGRHHHPILGVLALQPHQMVLEDRDVRDHPARLVRRELAPGGAGGIGLLRDHQLEVHRPVGIRAHHEAVAPVLQFVEQPWRAGLHQPRPRGAVGAGDQPHLAGVVVAAVDDDVGARERAAHPEEEPFVGLLVDQHVVERPATREPAVDLGRPAVLVPPDPVDRLRVR